MQCESPIGHHFRFLTSGFVIQHSHQSLLIDIAPLKSPKKIEVELPKKKRGKEGKEMGNIIEKEKSKKR